VRRDYRKWESPALGRDMELLVFGEHGSPVVVFPTSMGRFYQWEDFGMVAHLARRIEDGLLQLWCVDTVDGQSFYNKQIEPQERARRHVSYDRYLMDEVLPAIRRENNDPRLELLGASFGAFHAVALATRHPGTASRVIGLSGAYDAARWLNGVREDDAYFVNPLAFVPGLTDERLLIIRLPEEARPGASLRLRLIGDDVAQALVRVYQRLERAPARVEGDDASVDGAEEDASPACRVRRCRWIEPGRNTTIREIAPLAADVGVGVEDPTHAAGLRVERDGAAPWRRQIEGAVDHQRRRLEVRIAANAKSV